jgi:hypothetical protein
MSFLTVTTEPLTALEARSVSRSRIVQTSLLAMASAMCISLLLAIFLRSPAESLGEKAFTSVVVLLALAAQGVLSHLAVGIWRDARSNEKIVVRGIVSAVHRRTSSHGLHYSIQVGEKFVASDPLYSPVPGFISRVKVGEMVQVSFLGRSRRTLSVVPA